MNPESQTAPARPIAIFLIQRWNICFSPENSTDPSIRPKPFWKPKPTEMPHLPSFSNSCFRDQQNHLRLTKTT